MGGIISALCDITMGKIAKSKQKKWRMEGLRHRFFWLLFNKATFFPTWPLNSKVRSLTTWRCRSFSVLWLYQGSSRSGDHCQAYLRTVLITALLIRMHRYTMRKAFMDLQGKRRGEDEASWFTSSWKCCESHRTSPQQSASEIWTDNLEPSWSPCRCRPRQLKGRSETERVTKRFQSKTKPNSVTAHCSYHKYVVCSSAWLLWGASSPPRAACQDETGDFKTTF